MQSIARYELPLLNDFDIISQFPIVNKMIFLEITHRHAFASCRRGEKTKVILVS